MTDQEARDKALTYLTSLTEDTSAPNELRISAASILLSNTSEPWDPAVWNDDDIFEEESINLSE